jgi:aerobic carbon-monoxide dehydrogenase small subunit
MTVMQETAQSATARAGILVSIRVNGELHEARVEPRLRLTELLRQRLGLTGTKVGCETGQCGACVVLLDGVSVKSCTVLAVQADGARVTTVEGLASRDGSLAPLQQAFREHHAVQCGFCTPGMLLSMTDLLQRDPQPAEPEIRRWMDGTLCRCGVYQNAVRAVQSLAPGESR